MAKVLETDVLICGAGPVGLALAIELGSRGVRCIVCERREDASTDPKAKFVNLATMQIARRWGIADRIRGEAPLPADFPTNVVYATGMTGHEIARIENAFFTDPRHCTTYSEPGLRTTQPSFERSLLDHVLSLPGVTVLRGTQLLSFRESGNGIEADIRVAGAGSPHVCRASFLAGCDGARSTVREALGIPMAGKWGVARSVGAVFRSPALLEASPYGPAVHYWMIRDNIPVVAGMGPLDVNGQWFIQLMDLPEDIAIEAIDMQAVIRSCVGEVPFEIQSVSPWQIHHLSAERYRAGHAYILGDAAHLHSPTGGFGLNTGVGDAVDLGWKLSAVLEGWAPETILDTFECERRPIHDYVMNLSLDNLSSQKFTKTLTEARLDADPLLRQEFGSFIVGTKTRHYRSIAAQLGTGYFSSPLVAHAGRQISQPGDPTVYAPSAIPGSRAPHVWLDEGVAISDKFGAGFTLLLLGPTEIDASPLASAAAEKKVPLKVVRASNPRALAIFGAPLVLVRPDHYIAWCGETLPLDVLALVELIRGAAIAA